MPRPLLLPALLASTLVASLATASEHASASFRLTGVYLGAVGSHAQSAAPMGAFGESGVSLGQSEALGFSGSSSDLSSSAPGFWSIVAGALPSLDLDGDGAQNFRDDDDDGDGLLDTAETDTGIFLSATDSGSDPLQLDSDGDGLDDGFEVSQGSDPNDSLSPPSIPVPAAPLVGRLALALALAVGGAVFRTRSRRRLTHPLGEAR